MHALYLLSVWLHILAATVWIGGMIFLVLVVVPWLRSGGREQAGRFLRETGSRFSRLAWVCFGVLLVTGSFNLWMRGVRPGDFVSPDWLRSAFGHLVLAKLIVFALVLGVSFRHDRVGAQAALAIERDVRSQQTVQLRRTASILGRLNAVLALLLVALAVCLVRGMPW